MMVLIISGGRECIAYWPAMNGKLNFAIRGLGRYFVDVIWTSWWYSPGDARGVLNTPESEELLFCATFY